MLRSGPGPVLGSTAGSKTMVASMISMPRSTIWFEISRTPGQIKPRDFHGAVVAYGLEIAQIIVAQITVHIVDHELGLESSPEMTPIALAFFLVA